VIKKRKEKTPTPAKPVESSSTYRHGWTAPSRGPDPPGKWRARGWEATTAAAETKRKGRGAAGDKSGDESRWKGRERTCTTPEWREYFSPPRKKGGNKINY